MYGIVQISGHQYKVQEGDVIDVQKLDEEVGKKLVLSEVLFVSGKPIGTPHVSGAKVTAEVVKHDRSRKVIVFKRKPGAYQKKNGHRQQYTTLKIQSIKA